MAVMEAIETIYLEAEATSVLTGTLPDTYEHLQVRLSLRSEDGTVYVRYGDLKIRFNDLSAPTYWFHLLYGGDPYGPDGTTGAAVYKASAGAAKAGFAPRSLPADRSDSADYGGFIINILNYRNTNKYTTFSVVQGKSLTEPVALCGGGMWTSTDAVTSLKFISTDGWNRGSQITVYGVNSS